MFRISSIVSTSVSVIVPTFNRKELLRKALASILAQSFPVSEILVVDNNSTDGTEAMIIEEFPTVIYIKETKQGVSSARNKGIKAARGDWIAFLDSDDEWLPNKLERQFQTFFKEKRTARLLHTDEIWLKNNVFLPQQKKHQKKGGNLFFQCLNLCCISPSSVVIRQDLFHEIGYFDEAMPACEDYDMWLRISARNEVFFSNEKLVLKRGGHFDQLSKKYWAMDRFRVYALEKLLRNSKLAQEQKIAVNKMIVKRCEVLIKGGLKRKNMDLVKFYMQRVNCLKNSEHGLDLMSMEPKIYG